MACLNLRLYSSECQMNLWICKVVLIMLFKKPWTIPLQHTCILFFCTETRRKTMSTMLNGLKVVAPKLYYIIKPEKWECRKETVIYLGLIHSTKGISINLDEVETVINWNHEKKTPNGIWNNIFEVQQFLDYCNYYRQFIPTHSMNADPLTRLTKKDQPFRWESEQQSGHKVIVTVVTTATILHHFDHHREVVMQTDASDYVSSGVPAQQDNQRVPHSVAYFLKTHTLAECNYTMWNKELVTIIEAIEE